MFSKFATKLIQSLPTWEVTKYYGRVCIYQLKCLKYKVQTSEAWFNLKCKFMPNTLRKELECEDSIEPKVNNESKQQKEQSKVSFDTKSQDKDQCNSEDNKRTPSSSNDLKDNYIVNEFVASSEKQEKQETKKHQENSKYSTHEDVTKKKQKMKHTR